MIICVTEIYNDENPQTYFIDTNKAKSANAIIVAKFLEKLKEQTNVPYSAMSGDEGVISELTTKPPCLVEKQLDLYEDPNIELSSWIEKINKNLNPNKKPVDTSTLFSSSKAELPDGTSMKIGIGGTQVYTAIALKNLKDSGSSTIEVAAGEECQVIFLGYTNPSQIGLFSPQASNGSIPKFRISRKDETKPFFNHIHTAKPPVFGTDFALSLTTYPVSQTTKKNKI